MRPVTLTVSGLHSYREPVTVDFDELGRYGLFGIFGPIGAGKSTLLDAITLALYGLVDRVVGRSRRGLVHAGTTAPGHAAGRCEVRFRFVVGTGRPTDPHRTFEVHRAYRDEDGVAQRIASRVIELVAGRPPATLAEKETDVNALVEELVGLSSEDFLRAVVLPQGRFVQLLQLKGVERRQMLQRIFRLQAYGEDLRGRVRERQGAARTRQGEVRGELAGLGDASPDRVAAAGRAAAAARAARDDAERRHADLAASALDHARRRERHHRWMTLVVAADARALDAPRLEALARSLARAERLRPLLPALERCDRAEERAAAASAEAEAAREARATHTAAHAVRAAAAAAARQRLQDEGPGRRTRLARLEEAARDVAEGAELAASLAGWEAELPQHVAAEQAARAEADRLRVRVGELDRERRRVRRELGRARVEPAERERVARAARAADAVAVARRLLEEARAEELAAAGAVLVAVQRVAEADEAAAAAVARVAALQDAAAGPTEDPEPWVRRVEELRARRERQLERQAEVAALDAEHAAAAERLATAARALGAAEGDVKAASQVARQAEEALADAEVALAAHAQRTAAWTLSRRLGPGVACDVCGSVHHPAPAGPPIGDPAPAVEAHRLGQRRAAERRERAQEARAAATSARDGAQEALAAVAERRDRARGALDADAPAALDEALAALQAARDRAQEAALHRTALDAARVDAERAQVPVAAARATQVAAEAESQRTRELRLLRAAAEGLAWAAFDADRGELTLFDVRSAVAALEARDREVHAATERAEALDHDRDATQRAAEDERTRADRAAAAAARAREHADAARVRAAALTSRLRELLPEGLTDVAAALEAEGAALAALESAAAALDDDARAAQSALAAVVERHAALESAAAAARDEAARRREELAAGVVAALGAELPEGELRAELAAVPDEATAAEQAAAVDSWRAEDRALRAELAALEAEGTDGALDDAAYEALATTLAAAERELDAARDAAVLAAGAADELEGKAHRWSALCALSSALDGEVARLDELSQLLRGDRFVEYVANDHLQELTARASEHLASLTGGRYRLSLDDEAAFVVRDDELGGVVRPVTGLSGGESFLCALALALALSSLVQARSRRPLGFFFLDEGFGTLDPDALDRVMSAIEGLRSDDRLIGLISHVPEVRDRVPRYLLVSRVAGGASSVRVVDG